MISELKIRINQDEKLKLYGWASLIFDGKLFLNNISIFKKSEDISIVFPYIKNEKGIRYFSFNPITKEVYLEIKNCIKKAVIGSEPDGNKTVNN